MLSNLPDSGFKEKAESPFMSRIPERVESLPLLDSYPHFYRGFYDRVDKLRIPGTLLCLSTQNIYAY